MSLDQFGVITAVSPSDEGWRYEQPMRDGSLQRIPSKGDAGTPNLLIEQVQTFRAVNHLDRTERQDVEHDISVYIIKVSPMNAKFRGIRNYSPPVARPNSRPIGGRIRDWLLQLAPKQPRLIIADDASKRAEVCLGCPQNIKWLSSCSPCNDEVKARGRNLRQRAGFEHDEGLKACRCNSLFLPAAVFVDREFLPDPNEQSPENCWLRTESK